MRCYSTVLLLLKKAGSYSQKNIIIKLKG